jgi:ComF family protein
MKLIQYAASSLLHLLYPNICLGCTEEEIDNNEFLCLDCLFKLPYTGFERIQGNATEKMFWGRIEYKFICSIFYFIPGSPIQQIIHHIKYKNEKELGIFMGRLMGNRIRCLIEAHQIDFAIPMPLHEKKQYMRGYNQASLLSEGIKEMTQIPYNEKVLRRIEHTSTQTKKSRMERWENVADVFEVSDIALISGKNIMLIDDVITTGASTEACAQTLLSHGAGSVSICSLAFRL